MALAAGWARGPGASIPRLSPGQAYASKAACQLLGHAQATGPGLEWLLGCDAPATGFAQALVCARQYASRWLVEGF